MKAPEIVVIGIGSSHGDDCAGWRIVDALREQVPATVQLRKARSPIELIDALDEAQQVYLVDAAVGLASWDRLPAGQLTAERLDSYSRKGTHGFAVGDALKLAHSLGCRTDHVTVWLVRGETFAPLAEPSESSIAAMKACTKTLVKELNHARTLTR